MFGPIGGLVPGFFPVGVGQALLGETFILAGLKPRHVGVVVDGAGFVPPRLVQAMPHGAEEITMDPARHWTDRYAYVRMAEDYPGQAEDAAAIARLFVTEGVPYSFGSYVALAAWKYGIKAERLERWINRRRPPVSLTMPRSRTPFEMNGVQLPAEAICSVLGDQSWSLAGKRVMYGVAHQAVTPGAMALQLMRKPGTRWIIPGGVGWTV
jgi:hypothetical protein